MGGGALVLSVGVALLASALGEYRQYFYQPSEIGNVDFVPKSDVFRVGGNVVENSLQRGRGAEVSFQMQDFEGDNTATVSVLYSGALPDLFKEGSGAVVVGRWDGSVVRADELLAKHDENYRPSLD